MPNDAADMFAGIIIHSCAARVKPKFVSFVSISYFSEKEKAAWLRPVKTAPGCRIYRRNRHPGFCYGEIISKLYLYRRDSGRGQDIPSAGYRFFNRIEYAAVLRSHLNHRV